MNNIQQEKPWTEEDREEKQQRRTGETGRAAAQWEEGGLGAKAAMSTPGPQEGDAAAAPAAEASPSAGRRPTEEKWEGEQEAAAAVLRRMTT